MQYVAADFYGICWALLRRRHSRWRCGTYDQEQDVIHWVWQNRKRAGATTETFPKAKRLYLAIRTGQQAYGVVGIPMEKKTQPDAFTSSILFSILGECALTLESLRNAREKEETAVLAKNEQLRANLLAGLP